MTYPLLLLDEGSPNTLAVGMLKAEHQKVWGSRVKRLPAGLPPAGLKSLVTATTPHFLILSVLLFSKLLRYALAPVNKQNLVYACW